jgi:DNA primase
MRGLDRDLLPDPEDYFQDHLGRLRFNGAGWAKANCPVHGADRHPSLSVNLSGGWKCHRCDESGGDIISFEMFCTGDDFKQAVKTLGAWRS